MTPERTSASPPTVSNPPAQTPSTTSVASAPSAAVLAPALSKQPAMPPKAPVIPRKPPSSQRPPVKAALKGPPARPRPVTPSPPAALSGRPSADLLKEPITASPENDTSERSAAAKKSTADARAALKQQQAAVRAADASALAAEKTAFDKLLEKADSRLTKNIRAIEEDIEMREEEYITKTWAHGNVMRGWDGFVRRVDRADKNATGTGSGTATGAPKYRKSRPSDRIFSLSSSTSNFRKENPDVQIQKRPPEKKKKKKR